NPKKPESINIPSNLTLLLNEPLDNTKKLLIQKGDSVEKGQKICLYSDSAEYVIAPVAGTIRVIDAYIDALGNTSTFLVIKNIQTQTSDTKAKTYDLKEDIASADRYLRNLPGAPPFKKLADNKTKINTIVITCADADLLSTTSQYIALNSMDKIKTGARILKNIIGAVKICITVPQDLNIQGEFDSIQVFRTDTTYPSNLPAMILKNHLNMILPAGKTPEDLGVCFICAEAAASIADAYETKSAGAEKIVTIIGKQGTRYRVKATIGTPLRKIFDLFSIHINDQDRIIIGGPMQGISTYSPFHPVEPGMDTVIVQDRDEIPEICDNACVNCGKCVRICPANIQANILVRYLAADQYEEAADKCDLESCIECGLCAYVCTAKIPIYQYIKLGKHELKKLRAEA
ncbi:MAG: 4Fe-4S dicluster domain-containing protein, partial [Proteobacteria bacterium]|nr:4Fe-4S dicluster domain-containing protein [Pseudomonadota bacterium]